MNQKKTVNFLFYTAVIILILNLILDKFFLIDEGRNAELSSAQIDSAFRSSLYRLGIHKEWIKNSRSRDPEYLQVLIPKDLPAVVILQELNSLFDTSQVKINSVEKKIGGSTIINFISGDGIKLSAELIYSDKVKRKSARIGFLVDSFDAESDSVLLDYPEQFAFLLVPSKTSKEGVKKITEHNKEYVVYLNDDIKDLEFKLSESYSATRLKNSIREIVGAFPGAVCFMIDIQSTLYRSEVYPLLKDELEKRKIKLIDNDFFDNISSGEKNSPAVIFSDAADKINSGEDKIFIISAEDFITINPEIVRYRKLGFKFTNPSALLSR